MCLLPATYGQPQTADQQVSSPFPELLPLPAQPKPSLVRGPSAAGWSVCWPLIQHSVGSRLGWFRARHDHGERRRKGVELELLLPAASLKPFGTTKRSSRPQPRRTGMGIVSRLVRGSHVRPALRDTVTAGQGEEEEEFSDKKQR